MSSYYMTWRHDQTLAILKIEGLYQKVKCHDLYMPVLITVGGDTCFQSQNFKISWTPVFSNRPSVPPLLSQSG